MDLKPSQPESLYLCKIYLDQWCVCLDWRRAQTGQTSEGQAGKGAGTDQAGQEQAGRTDPGRIYALNGHCYWRKIWFW